MSKEIFDAIAASNHDFNGGMPHWLQERIEPEFKVHTHGEGNTNLVLLHGLLGAMTNWDDTIPYFKQFARTIALHFPILTAPRTDVKIKSLAAFTEYYLRANNIRSPRVLCGNSLGGHVALRLTMAAPEMVDALVLAGSSGLYEHTVDTLPIRPSKEFIRSQTKRVFYDEKFITDEAVDDVFNTLRSRKHQLNIIHAARSAKKDFLLDHLKDINKPVLLVWGEEDLVTTMDVAETFHKNLPNSKLVVFEKCGHAPMIEHPEKFGQAVKDFLEEQNLLRK